MGARVYVAAAAAAFLLGGCATTTKAPVCSAASGDAVDLHGRLAVKYTQNSEPKSMTVNYSWSQTPQCTNVALSMPIGSTIATIEVTPEQAVLTESGKPPRSAPDIDTLTARILGWSLPVAGLREWMQGYATAADGKRFNASPGNTDVTTKDGWRLSFVSWQDGSNPPKPKRIDAERSASGQIEEVSLRIVIDAE
ncbi:lipoprotein insertase outer membrane protein LolB [Pseudoduganella sp. RAF53_2]|uniref:lipoprotein insertase outer membrane protein LolB n=1 Tax=unclassified Pseudoduganella TaxID=2637179 RepID=UPI003F9D18F6